MPQIHANRPENQRNRVVAGKVFSCVGPMTRICAFVAREAALSDRPGDGQMLATYDDMGSLCAPHIDPLWTGHTRRRKDAASIGLGNELLAWQVRERSIYKFGNCCISSRASQRSLERRCFVSTPMLHVLRACRSPGAASLWRVELARIHRKHRFREANQRKTAAGHPSAGQAERSDPHDALIG
jgi:hypothetical protein